MIAQEFKNRLSTMNNAYLQYDEPMSNHTSFRIGGPADVLITLTAAPALAEVISLCNDYDVPFYVIGAGSNLLVSDRGIRGAVIRLATASARCEGCTIFADAGISLAALAKFALENSLTGLEFASGIPGLLGGALYMNAGAYGDEMKNVAYKTSYITPDGSFCALSGDEHRFGYRSSVFSAGDMYITNAQLLLTRGDKEQISTTMRDLNARRREKQPLSYPSAGSTFKRPEGYFAAKLIEDAGLKDFSIGGARVSKKHAGFIINSSDATAAEVIRLIEHIKLTVYNKFGVELTCEVKMLGEF